MRHEHYGRGLWVLPAWPEVPVDPHDADGPQRRATPEELAGMRQKWRIVAEHEDGRVLADSGVVRDEFRSAGDPWTDLGMGEPVASDQHHGLGSRYRQLPDEWRERAHRVVVVRHPKGGGKAKATRPMSPQGHGPLPEVAHRAPDAAHLVRQAQAHPEARRLRVRPTEVQDGDVVAGDPHPAHRWAGEPVD